MNALPRQDIAALTGLRGIAACWVAAYHGHEFGSLAGPPGILLRHGYLAVDVFFVLSGFVMGLSYARLFAPGFRAASFGAFLLRRAARVYPLYIGMTCLAALFAIAHVWRHGGDAWSLARQGIFNVTLTQAWGFAGAFDGPAWSISTEFAAYLLFPVLIAATLGRGRATFLTSMLVASVAVIVVSRVPTPATYPWPRQGALDVSWVSPPWALVRCCAEFTIGLGTYRIATARDRRVATAPFSAVVCVLLAATLLIRGSDLPFVALTPALLLSLTGANPLSRLVGSRVPFVLGEWSFAIYLWHAILLDHWRPLVLRQATALVGHSAAAVAAEIAFWLLLLVLAYLSFRFIEVPGRTALRRLEHNVFPVKDRSIAMGEANATHSI